MRKIVGKPLPTIPTPSAAQSVAQGEPLVTSASMNASMSAVTSTATTSAPRSRPTRGPPGGERASSGLASRASLPAARCASRCVIRTTHNPQPIPEPIPEPNLPGGKPPRSPELNLDSAAALQQCSSGQPPCRSLCRPAQRPTHPRQPCPVSPWGCQEGWRPLR